MRVAVWYILFLLLHFKVYYYYTSGNRLLWTHETKDSAFVSEIDLPIFLLLRKVIGITGSLARLHNACKCMLLKENNLTRYKAAKK